MFRFIRTLLSQFIHPAFVKNHKPVNKKIEVSSTTNEENDQDIICSLEVQMNEDGTINIVCGWPDFALENKSSIPTIAYQYALVIDAINSGMLSKEILDTIKNYQSDNTMDILFAQNVIYKLSEMSFLRKQNSNKIRTEPVVRPLEVFKQIQS